MPISWMNIDGVTTDADLLALIRKIKEEHSSDPDVAASLSRVLSTSGIQIPRRSPHSADVASTGGPSSLSTLICPLLLRAAGACVPKLGVPGRPAGGIDCLAQIPGYRAVMSPAEVDRGLSESGYIHFLGGESIAPLDSRMFRLRQENSAQEVPTLVVASRLSKKLAVGVQVAGLDIRVAPHGNFGKDWEEAERNARLFVEVGQRVGIEATAVLTDGRFPYRPYIGRKEALLALNKIFAGDSPAWLTEHFELCRTLALASAPNSMRSRLSKASVSDLEAVFLSNVKMQGGDLDALDRMIKDLAGDHNVAISANEAGFAHFDLHLIRKALVYWQNSCTENGRIFPDPVGLILTKRSGEWVDQGATLATVRIDGFPQDEVVISLQHAIRVASTPSNPCVKGLE